MFTTRIETLAPEHDALLRHYRDRWSNLRMSSLAADRLTAEIGIEKAYLAAGLEPPKEIVWADGPYELARVRPGRENRNDRNVLPILINEPLRKISGRLSSRLSDRVLAEINTRARRGAVPFVSRMASDVVESALGEVRTPLHALMRWLSRRWARDFDPTVTAIWTQHDNEWLWPHDFIRDAFGMVREIAPLDGLLMIAGSAGFIVPHQRICWAGERHDILRRDTFGRLHAADGPALAYRDGWKAYFWKGIRLSPWLIERKEHITNATINFERDPVVRRCMIGIVTPENYIASGSVSKLASDETGTLWRRFWQDDTWTCVEVVNGTPEADGSYKRYFLEVPPHVNTPREAVAWTYGMTSSEYEGLILRT